MSDAEVSRVLYPGRRRAFLLGAACALAALAGFVALVPSQQAGAWPRRTLVTPRGEQCFSAGRVLPAGVFYRTVGWYEAEFDRCPTPAVALVARAHADTQEATATVRSLRGRALAPGYPWAVAEPYAGLAGSGIAVVVGLFASVADAEAWRARLPDVPLTVAPLLPEREALAALQAYQAGRRAVVQIIAPAPVPAYAEEDLDRLLSNDRRERASVRPRCMVDPDTVFDAAGHTSYGHTVSPVRCGAETAFVRRTTTNVEAVVWRGRDGRDRISQVTEVACDCPTHTTWVLDGRRRTRPDETTACPSGC